MSKRMSRIIILLSFTLMASSLYSSDALEVINLKRALNKKRFNDCLAKICPRKIRNCRKKYADLGRACLNYYSSMKNADKCLNKFCVDLGVNCQKWCIDDYKEEGQILNEQERQARSNQEVTPSEVVEVCEDDCYERAVHCLGQGKFNQEVCKDRKNNCLSGCHFY